jgi:hypothetical protein
MAAGLSLVSVRAWARGTINGRLFLTYQKSDAFNVSNEFFIQHYEATIKDKVLAGTDLSFSYFFDSAKNLSFEQTTRRHQGRLDLKHRFYDFHWRFAPRQKVTPIEIEPSRERTENQLTFYFHVPKYPGLRLQYQKRGRYELGRFTGQNEDFRGDLRYRIKILELTVNKWVTKAENASVSTTDVTGAGIRLAESFRQYLFVRGGYDYRRNKIEKELTGTEILTQNHLFNGLLSARYRQYVGGALNVTSRRVSTENAVSGRTEDDVVVFSVKGLPQSALSLDGSWNYQRLSQNDRRTLINYVSLSALLRGRIWKDTDGRLQAAKRHTIKVVNAAAPGDLVSAALKSMLTKDVKFDAEISVTKSAGVLNLEDTLNVTPPTRYQTFSTFNLFLTPHWSLQFNTRIQLLKFSDYFGLTKYNRRMYTIGIIYFPARQVTLSTEWRRHVMATDDQRTESSGAVTLGVLLRSKTTVNVAYSFNEVERKIDETRTLIIPDNRRESWNVSAQYWITKRGSISASYLTSDATGGISSNYATVTYRQDF